MGKQRHSHPPKKYRFFHLGLWIVLLIFFVLSTIYSIIVPLTQGEDELAHYRYISFIAQTGRLPTNYAERKQAWYRADWPPLYHLLVGWVVAPIDTNRPHLKDVGESPRRRLVGEIFYPRLIIYTEDANWPWQDGILAWHLGRFISVLFSGTALVFTYFTALELCRGAGERRSGGEVHKSPPPPRSPAPENEVAFPCRWPPLFATATTALLAFTPRYLFTSAMLGDDSLFILLSAIFIWLLLRALRGNDRWWVYAVLGLLLGFSIATKYSTGLLPLVIIPVVWWRARQASWSWLQSLGRLALAWVFTLLGSSWWFGWLGYYFNTIEEDGVLLGLLRSLLATGPDVSMGRVFAFFKGAEFSGPIRPGAIAEGTFAEWTTYLFQTFWGVPVLEYDPLFPGAYLLLLILSVPAVIGLWFYWKIADTLSRVTGVVLALIVLLLVPFPVLRFFLTFNILETGQGRHILYPAAQSIPILLMLGWFSHLPFVLRHLQVTSDKEHLTSDKSFDRGLNALWFRLYALFIPILLLVWSIFQLLYMLNTYPAPLPVQTTTFNAASIPQPLKHNFSQSIQFLGYDFQPDPEQAIINLTLFWKSLEAVDENFRTRVQLVDADGQAHFTWLSHPLNGRFPTRAWDKGDIIRDTLSLPLAAVPADTYTLQIDLLYEAEDVTLNDEPFWIIQVPLAKTQPIANASKLTDELEYRLWVDEAPARYRQTLPLSWNVQNQESKIQNPEWVLIGPDDVPRPSIATGDATTIFMVGADWPSGDYRLGLAGESIRTEPLLTVANEARSFDLPADLSAQPGWTPVEANLANKVELVGYILPGRRVEPGSGLPLTLYWRSLGPVLGDYVVFDVLLDKNQQVYGGYDRLPREYYSTILWGENEVVEDGFAVPVSPDAPAGIYNLHVGLYSLETGEPVSLPLIQDGQPTGATSVVIGPIKVDGSPSDIVATRPNPQFSLNKTFGDQITLLGYDLIDEDGQPNQNLKLTLYWQAETIPTADYTTFVHLRDEAGENITQKDQPPAQGQYPSSLWDSGDIIVDEIILPLENVPPGHYTPVIGLYDFATGMRLTLAGGAETELRLENVNVP